MILNVNQSTVTVNALQAGPNGLAGGIFELLDQKKAKNLLLLNLQEVNSYFDFFLLATATSEVHLKSLLRDITREFSRQLPHRGAGFRPAEAESGWVIIDFIEIVVHLFLEEQRRFYNLERLWGDARIERKS